MARKLFVGGLSWGTNDEQLKAAFEAFGPVSEAKVVLDQATGRSRGFGFVTFATDDNAQTAQLEMDGAKLDGRTLRVNPAEERQRAPRTAGSPSGRGGGSQQRGRSDRPARPSHDKRRGRPEARRGGDKFSRRRGQNDRQPRRGPRGFDSGDEYETEY